MDHKARDAYDSLIRTRTVSLGDFNRSHTPAVHSYIAERKADKYLNCYEEKKSFPRKIILIDLVDTREEFLKRISLKPEGQLSKPQELFIIALILTILIKHLNTLMLTQQKLNHLKTFIKMKENLEI